MSKKKANELSNLSQGRGDLIAELLDKFEQYLDKAGNILSKTIIMEFLDKLKMEGGLITSDAENIRKNALIDKAWSSFSQSIGVDIISKFVLDLQTISNENLKYYRKLSDSNIKSTDIRNIIFARLGIDDKGNLVKDGYMKGLLDDVSVRNEIKKFAFQKVISGTGYDDLRTGLNQLINGNDESMGKFKQFYRNFAYDTYVQTDRLNASLYAEKLNLRYFIYQGTKRKDSRYFCIQRKNKVFTTEEAKEWVNLIGTTTEMEVNGKIKRVPAGPIVQDKATYNPVIDMGGFGCVDVASFISEEIAFALRPNLKNSMTVSEDYILEHKGSEGANVYVHKDADKNDLPYNLRNAKRLANIGEPVKIRKHVNQNGISNPELELSNGILGDFKEPEPNSSIRTSINSQIKRANLQGAEIPILLLSKKFYDKGEIIRALNGSLSSMDRNKAINEVWILMDDKLIKIPRTAIKNKDYYFLLP